MTSCSAHPQRRTATAAVMVFVACFSEAESTSSVGATTTSTDVGPGTTVTSTSTPPETGTSTENGGSASTSTATSESSSTTTGTSIDYVLAFEGANDGVTPELPGLPPNFTVEFWLRSGPEMHGAFLYTATMDPTPRGWYFIHDRGPGLAFTNVLVYINYDERPAWDYVTDATLDLRAQVGWHHVAVTKSIDGLVRMWVDGGIVTEHQFGAPFGVSERPLTIGPSLHDAMMDDIRISDIVRYDALFEPPDDMIVDADTLYLWKLDEGEGSEAVDEVAGVAFSFVAPIWVER